VNLHRPIGSFGSAAVGDYPMDRPVTAQDLFIGQIPALDIHSAVNTPFVAETFERPSAIPVPSFA